MSSKFVRKYVFDYFCMNIKKQLSVMMMLFFSVMLCGYALFFYGSVYFADWSSDRLLTEGNEHTGVIQTNILQSQDGIPLEKISRLDEVNRVGFYGRLSLYSMEQGGYFEALHVQERSLNSANEEGNFNFLDTFFVTDELYDLCQMKFAEGGVPERYEQDVLYVCLGNGYKDIPVGSEFRVRDYYKNEYTGVVCGILEKGSTWITNDLYGGLAAPVINLDQEILILANGVKEYVIEDKAYVFTGSNLSDFAEVCASVAKVCEPMGQSVTVTSFAELFHSTVVEMYVFMRYLLQLLVLVLIVTVMLMICTQAVITLDGRRIFGIWYANGASRRDVAAVIFGNILLEIVIVAVSSGCLGLGMVHIFAPDPIVLKTFLHVYWYMTVPGCAGIMLLNGILGAAIALGMTQRDKPATLIKQYMR